VRVRVGLRLGTGALGLTKRQWGWGEEGHLREERPSPPGAIKKWVRFCSPQAGFVALRRTLSEGDQGSNHFGLVSIRIDLRFKPLRVRTWFSPSGVLTTLVRDVGLQFPGRRRFGWRQFLPERGSMQTGVVTGRRARDDVRGRMATSPIAPTPRARRGRRIRGTRDRGTCRPNDRRWCRRHGLVRTG
jgi:hypothetical protein